MPDLSLVRELHYRDRVVACWPDRPESVHAMLEQAVARDPDRVAVICGDTRLSYGALDDEIGRVAGGLAARGVGSGDRVAMMLGNSVAFVVILYALARLGAIAVPISIRERLPGVRHALTHSGATCLVAEAGVADLVPALADTPRLRARFVIGTAEGFDDYETLLAAQPLLRPEPVDEDAAATILYTSGTTGTPKGAMLTHLGIVHSATNFVHGMDLGPGDRTIVVVPMSHVTGLIAGIHTLIRAGGSIVIQREFDAIPFLDLASQERMTVSLMVPAMYNLCLHRARLSDYDLSAWRVGGYGGAPMPAATIERLAEELPGLGLMNAYGATETTSPATLMPAEETAARRLSVGRPVPGAEIVVMDENGREVPPGESGEIWIRGAMVVPGYWDNPEANAREFRAGFWKSGDIGSVDRDGFVHVHDRKKDMINRGGHKIYTAMVESVLCSCDGVLEAAVIAKPCPMLGERVHAVLSINPTRADEAAISRRCSEALADYQVPESFTLTPDPLPRNANGKVLKRKLKANLGFA